MRLRRRLECVFAALLLVTVLAGTVLAQDQELLRHRLTFPYNKAIPDRMHKQQDPPGRVARVQYMSGQVSMQPGGVNDWEPPV